jgi:hypothetical protein
MTPQPSRELTARFTAVLQRFPQAERRQMFGMPAAFIGGNLATGLYGEGWMVRLGPDEALRVVAQGQGSAFEPMAGRPMKGYVLLPAAVAWDDEAIADWVGRALAYTGTIPAKR